MTIRNRPEVEAEVRARQVAWMDAWIARDRNTLERMLAPEFALVVSAQPLAKMDRTAWLATATTQYTCTAFRYDGMQVRDFGDFVVVSSLATQTANAFGNDRSGTFFLTDIWREGDRGEWQVVARYSAYPEPDTASAAAVRAASGT